ncbi:MAG: hypothetical protein HC820_03650 [Hydrococcus sp. RM1_1_31]|nr:hypothetical protein [Hydrococcus sp. RM1_1_31]
MKTDRQSSAPIWVSLATSPFLIGVLTVRSLTQTLIELGEASEEVFRGDRLPILNFPDRQEHEQEPN